MREKPYGHIAYQRRNPSGKVSYIPAKGVKRREKEIQQERGRQSSLRGRLFEQLFASVLESALSNIDKYPNIETVFKDNPSFKEQFIQLNDTTRKVLLYNLSSSIKSLKTALMDRFNKVKSVKFMGNNVGIGKKADVVIEFEDTTEAYTNMSKIATKPNSLGISIKTISGEKSGWITAFTGTYKSTAEVFELPLNKEPKTGLKERIDSLRNLIKLPEDEIKERFVRNIEKVLEDVNYPDLLLLISDFSDGKTYMIKEKELTKKIKDALKESKMEILHRKGADSIDRIMIAFAEKSTGKRFMLFEPRFTRNNISIRFVYSYILDFIKENSQKH